MKRQETIGRSAQTVGTETGQGRAHLWAELLPAQGARLVCRSTKPNKEFCRGEINHMYVVHREEESDSSLHVEG